MTGFHPSSAYEPQKGLQLLPFRFLRWRDGRLLLVNDAGEHLFVADAYFRALLEKRLTASDEPYDDLKARHFIADDDLTTPVHALALQYRTRHAFLAGFTKLHIFVVSLRCEHSCHYCQVSRVSADRTAFDMSQQTAEKSLELVFRSPSRSLKIEFQGGEPLLNFERIVQIVESAEHRAAEDNRQVEFVVATNLALVTGEMLAFFRDHHVALSTSLDGPAELHNANRPRRGNDSYERTIEGIAKARAVLGDDAVSALVTLTRRSLTQPEAIVDEYVANRFSSIFLRALSPYGFALKADRNIGYTVAEFLAFYDRALDHILRLNENGIRIVEIYAQILLTRILTPFPTGYVDLQSPAGTGIGVAVYNYDGSVYPSDESRMLAAMGNDDLCLGNVHANTYEQLFGGRRLRRLIDTSILTSMPGCSDCALQPFCGADPVFHYATQGDPVGHRPTSAFHEKHYALITSLLRRCDEDETTRRIFWSWVTGVPHDVAEGVA